MRGKRSRPGRLEAVVMAGALCLLAAPVFAQSSTTPSSQTKVAGGFDQVKKLPPGGPAPRLSDGHVDLSGRYYPNSGGRMLEEAYPVDKRLMGQFDAKVTPETAPVFKAGMAEKYKSPVPYGECDQAGTPSSITMQANQHGPTRIDAVSRIADDSGGVSADGSHDSHGWPAARKRSGSHF